MSRSDNGGRRRFTAADALIAVIVVALAVGSVLLFLLPDREESTAVPVKTSILVHFGDLPSSLAVGDKLFYGETEIGVINKLDKSANNAVIEVTVDRDDGVYLLGTSPLRVNGSFVLETRLCRAEGVIESIDETGALE